MTREHKVALIVGFALVLVVGTLIADHFSDANRAQVNRDIGSGGLQHSGQYATGEPALPSPIPSGDPIDPLLSAAPGELASAVPGPSVQTPPPASSVFEVVMGGPRPELTSPELSSEQPHGTLRSAGNAIRNGISQLGLDSSEPALRLDNAPQRIPERSAAFADTTLASPPPAAVPAPAPRQPEAPVTRGKLQRHEVVRGDNLSKIAAKYYGDRNLWRRLQTYNASSVGADGAIRTGTTLLIPPKDVLLGEARLAADAQATTASRPTQTQPEPPAPVRPKAADPKPAKPAPRTYTVRPGDTLLEIAQSQLGTTKRWKEIRDLNKSRLDDLDTIHVGLVLALPSE